MREQITKNNISVVSIALAAFVANNNRLPRPALNENGHESEESEMKCIGKVPYYTLGIHMKNAADGNGRPLVYIVEKQLTYNYRHIYDTTYLDSCFCDEVSDQMISINTVARSYRNPIAFVIDTEENPPVVSEDSKKITVTISKNTYWVLRDILLMQYLKNSPCAKEDNSYRHGGDASVPIEESNTNLLDLF